MIPYVIRCSRREFRLRGVYEVGAYPVHSRKAGPGEPAPASIVAALSSCALSQLRRQPLPLHLHHRLPPMPRKKVLSFSNQGGLLTKVSHYPLVTSNSSCQDLCHFTNEGRFAAGTICNSTMPTFLYLNLSQKILVEMYLTHEFPQRFSH